MLELTLPFLLEITYKIKAAEVGESWKRKAIEMFQSDPDYFDAGKIEVCYIEGCLVAKAFFLNLILAMQINNKTLLPKI